MVMHAGGVISVAVIQARRLGALHETSGYNKWIEKAKP